MTITWTETDLGYGTAVESSEGIGYLRMRDDKYGRSLKVFAETGKQLQGIIEHEFPGKSLLDVVFWTTGYSEDGDFYIAVPE